jgi:hypothetical protein
MIDFNISINYYKMTFACLEESKLIEAASSIKECSYYNNECIRRMNAFEKEKHHNPQSLITLNSYTNKDMLLEHIESVTVEECVVDGILYKSQADRMLDECINNEEFFNPELIWNAIDLYRNAIVNIKDHDIELECEILSRIGLIYEKVLKIDKQAEKYYYESFNLAETLKPKILNNFSWYKRCMNGIKKYQDAKKDKEDKEYDEKKNSVLEEIKADIEKIKEENQKSNTYDKYAKFIKFIYNTYPPKNESHKLDEKLLEENLKKTYLYSLTHYHTDKNSEAKFGLKW